MVPQNELQGKQRELELDANALISSGGKVCFRFSPFWLNSHNLYAVPFCNIFISFFQVTVAVLPYAEAVELCGGCLPDYIPQVVFSNLV